MEVGKVSFLLARPGREITHPNTVSIQPPVFFQDYSNTARFNYNSFYWPRFDNFYGKKSYLLTSYRKRRRSFKFLEVDNFKSRSSTAKDIFDWILLTCVSKKLAWHLSLRYFWFIDLQRNQNVCIPNPNCWHLYVFFFDSAPFKLMETAISLVLGNPW